MKDDQVRYCAWCQDPARPDPVFHPGGLPEHVLTLPRVTVCPEQRVLMQVYTVWDGPDGGAVLMPGEAPPLGCGPLKFVQTIVCPSHLSAELGFKEFLDRRRTRQAADRGWRGGANFGAAVMFLSAACLAADRTAFFCLLATLVLFVVVNEVETRIRKI